MTLAITFIVFLAILIITHEFGHFILAKLFKVRVDEFAFGFPPKIFTKKVGDTTYSLNAVPFGGFVKLYGENEEGADPNENPQRSYYIQPAWKRAAIIAAGVLMNFLVGWFAFSIVIFFTGVPQAVYIGDVASGSPAAQAGLRPDEKIEGFKSISSFKEYVEYNIGKEITINGKTVVPRESPPENEGRLGIALREGDFEKHNPFTSLYLGFVGALTMVGQILEGLGLVLASIFTGGDVLQSLAGPVGILTEIEKASSVGLLYLVEFLGVLSLNLAVFNLLPIPALDGGRLLFIGLEKVLGRRLDIKAEAIANLVGFALLILLAITVTVNDITRLM